MPPRSQTIFTYGESGSGKSLARCAMFLVNDFLPNETGIHFSNFPVNIQEIANYMGWSYEKTAERIKILPQTEMQLWAEGTSGPWEYFKDKPDQLKGAHVAIDEAHRYCSSQGHSKSHLAEWGKWCGGVRHAGGTVEFITQNHAKVAPSIKNEAGLHIQLMNANQRTEPVTGCRWYDVLQLLSKIRSKQLGLSWELEMLPTEKNGIRKIERTRMHWHQAKFYKLYDSYNVIEDEGQGTKKKGKETPRPKEPWEKYGWFRLLAFVYFRNLKACTLRAFAFCFLFWAIPMGGISQAIAGVLSTPLSLGNTLAAGEDEPEELEPQPTLAPQYANRKFPTKPISTEATNDARIKQLEETNRELATKLQDLSQWAQQTTSLVAILPDRVIFADGTQVRIGERVSQGKYIGRLLDKVDQRRGAATLSDGTVLQIGVMSPVAVDRLRQLAAQEQFQPREIAREQLPRGVRELSDKFRAQRSLPGSRSSEENNEESTVNGNTPDGKIRSNTLPRLPQLGGGGNQPVPDRRFSPR